jgi:hypothetical protein
VMLKPQARAAEVGKVMGLWPVPGVRRAPRRSRAVR